MRIILILMLSIFISTTAHATDVPSLPTVTKAQLLSDFSDDLVIGQADAPVTIIEYASLTCGHCANFHNEIYPQLKENYIDTGKVRFVFRHFPLNLPAVKGAVLIECLPRDKQEKFLKVLFKTYDKWGFSQDFNVQLKNIARVGGVSVDTFDACMENKALEDEVLAGRLAGSNVLKVESTPTIFLNGEKVQDRSYEALSKAIDAAL